MEMPECRVILKLSEDGSGYELFEAALIFEDDRPFAVEPDPNDRTPESAKYELSPEHLERRPNDADGIQVFAYRSLIVLPRIGH
jgi:hypothetical protein